MPFRLQTSGDLRLYNHDREMISFPEKGLLIIAYLLAQGESRVSRARLAKLIWGGVDMARGLTNLRQTATRTIARQDELGVHFLTFSQSDISFNAGTLIADLDVLLSIRQSEGDLPVRLEHALAQYRLPFLSEYQNPSPSLCDWIEEKQLAFAELMSDAIRRAIPQSGEFENAPLIRGAARRLFESDPDNQVARGILDRQPPQARPQHGLDAASALAAQATRAFAPDMPIPHHPARQTDGALDLLRSLFERQFALPKASGENARLEAREDLAALPRLAILPPGENDPDGLVAALLEDITIGLCSSHSLRIVAPYTAARISRQQDRSQLIIQHAIAYVLDTRINVAAGEMGLFAQLVYVPSDAVVWADRFPLDAERYMIQRQAIAQQVTRSISAHVERNEVSRLYFESNPQAYYHYLQGQSSLQHLTLPEIRRARKSFRLALQEKSDFGPALSGLARTNHLEWLITARGEPGLLENAEQQAKEAIKLCGDLTSGYRELGVTKLFLGAFDESVEALLTAESLSPQYADVIADFGDTLIHASRPAEGLAKLLKAIELNPVTPDGYLWAAAGANYYLEDYFAALAYINRMSDQTPALRLAAACRAMIGDMRQAKALSRKLKEQYPDFDVDRWLSVLPIREQWQREHYRHGLKKAGL
nr:hypothetical protein [uncultured Gellertiella sp.]